MFAKLAELYKFNIEEQNNLEKQEIRSKHKKPIGNLFAVKFRRGGKKFSMEDLEQLLKDKKEAFYDLKLPSFVELYYQMIEKKDND